MSEVTCDSPVAPATDSELPEIYQKRPQLFRPGQSGNPAGKPVGTLCKSTPWVQGDVSEADWAKLEVLSRADLISLIKRVGGAIWGYALKSDEEKAEAAQLKLYSLGMSSNESHKVIAALKEWFDRTKGKPAQSIAMTVKQDPVSKLSSDQLAALLSQLPSEPMIIPPMPKANE